MTHLFILKHFVKLREKAKKKKPWLLSQPYIFLQMVNKSLLVMTSDYYFLVYLPLWLQELSSIVVSFHFVVHIIVNVKHCIYVAVRSTNLDIQYTVIPFFKQPIL